MLTFAYTIGSASITVANNGQVAFTPVAVGGSSTVRFVVNNTGTASTSIGSIRVVQTGTTFGPVLVPSLPITIQPNGSFAFRCRSLPRSWVPRRQP